MVNPFDTITGTRPFEWYPSPQPDPVSELLSVLTDAGVLPVTPGGSSGPRPTAGSLPPALSVLPSGNLMPEMAGGAADGSGPGASPSGPGFSGPEASAAAHGGSLGIGSLFGGNFAGPTSGSQAIAAALGPNGLGLPSGMALSGLSSLAANGINQGLALGGFPSLPSFGSLPAIMGTLGNILSMAGIANSLGLAAAPFSLANSLTSLFANSMVDPNNVPMFSPAQSAALSANGGQAVGNTGFLGGLINAIIASNPPTGSTTGAAFGGNGSTIDANGVISNSLGTQTGNSLFAGPTVETPDTPEGSGVGSDPGTTGEATGSPTGDAPAGQVGVGGAPGVGESGDGSDGGAGGGGGGGGGGSLLCNYALTHGVYDGKTAAGHRRSFDALAERAFRSNPALKQSFAHYQQASSRIINKIDTLSPDRRRAALTELHTALVQPFAAAASRGDVKGAGRILRAQTVRLARQYDVTIPPEHLAASVRSLGPLSV